MPLEPRHLFPALENDELGLAVAIARNGSHFIELQRRDAVPVTGAETTVELTYLLQIGKHLALQPDLRYVIRPGTGATRKGALAVALRFELSYWHVGVAGATPPAARASSLGYFGRLRAANGGPSAPFATTEVGRHCRAERRRTARSCSPDHRFLARG